MVRKMLASDFSPFNELPECQRDAILRFIRENYENGNRASSLDDYFLKHDFEISQDGFYISNKAMRGALLWSLYKPHRIIVHPDGEETFLFHIQTQKRCPYFLKSLGRSSGYKVPCWHKPNIASGVCNYHSHGVNESVQRLPDYDEYLTIMEEKRAR